MSTVYGEVATAMENRLNTYVEILGTVQAEGVVGGHVHDNLVLFQNKVAGLKGQLESCVAEVQGLCTQYVEDIDEADSDLY